MIIKFEESTGLQGNNIVVAYSEENEGIRVLGKYYKGSGLCWNIVDPVRINLPLIEQWKSKLIEDMKNTKKHDI